MSDTSSNRKSMSSELIPCDLSWQSSLDQTSTLPNMVCLLTTFSINPVEVKTSQMVNTQLLVIVVMDRILP